MKDPIVVASRQIAELNRLLANRIDPTTCQPDSAGVVSGDTVDVSRDIMYLHKQHRLVFCECKDWPSKFQADVEWCGDWANDNYDRFYNRPYNFDTGGQF
jgi:hypothetical protein